MYLFLVGDEHESSLVCCSCGNESSGFHKCIRCDKAVHAISVCSEPAPNSEENFGQPRICNRCNLSQGNNISFKVQTMGCNALYIS